MLKRLIVVLLISMFAISSVYAQEEKQPNRDKNYSLNPYDIGVNKVIDVPGTLKIEYKNVAESMEEVRLIGTVIIPPNYEVINLIIDYYVFDGKKTYTRVVQVPLLKGAMPNTFTFDVAYPFKLEVYEFELFVIDFVNELHNTIDA